MLRKYLLLGLMGILGSIVVWMVMVTRRQNTSPGGPVETVRSVQPTATRSFAPKDLEITESSMELSAAATEMHGKASSGLQATHRLTVLNKGSVPYSNLLVAFAYAAADGKELHTKNHLIADYTIMPGQSLFSGDIAVQGVPAGTVRSMVRIVYAEIGPAPKAGDAAPKKQEVR